MADSKKYETIQIGEGAWRIEDEMVRAFLFTGTDRAMLVDTGFGGGDLKAAVESLTQLPVLLVNTHADDDHTGCNSQFGAAHMHPAEFSYYYRQQPKEAEVAPLWDGDVIDLGGRRFEVVLIPGHTPGSIALLDREARILVAGDSVTESPVFIFSEFRSLRAFVESMGRLQALKGAFDSVYGAHGPVPVSPDQIDRLKVAGEKLLAGELEGVAPPFELPARMYEHGGAAFFY